MPAAAGEGSIRAGDTEYEGTGAGSVQNRGFLSLYCMVPA